MSKEKDSLTFIQHLADCDAEDALETAEKRLAHLNAADTFKADDEGLGTRRMMDMLIAETKRHIEALRAVLGLPGGVE